MLSLLVFAVPIQAARTAVPGTVNYIEGQVSLDSKQLNTGQAGDAVLQADQILNTGHGKAEVLLSPGAFLRLGSNSEVRMVSPELADAKVEILRGEAMVEVDNKPKSANLSVMERGASASLLKQGLYRFDADEGRISVIDGKAQVGNTEFGKGREVVLNGAPLKPQKFDRDAKDELYRWSEVRSSYLAQVNQSTARTVYVNGGWGGWGNGWFWNPYFSTWSWLPGDGYFVSPFGYSFYSPLYFSYGYAPFYGYRGGGFYRGGGGRFAGRSFGGFGGGARFGGHAGRR